ncbi:MAG: biopolymer transporter ExbD [Bacteroidales bacterium]|nr:biopolymer transporter ExbD [Bacteroidales bacterium]MBD5281673.1 biopolymer transporter ExbD [Bacteroides sp.]MDE6034014.1 biopolymer transporter ExbD [Muribaculaceae bacterium]MBD5294083.1 biopolymer transporter ExbD [Bacteroides sp.]MBD5342884.1 biopolymer transporter ExbD [Bacteroides sp.]
MAQIEQSDKGGKKKKGAQKKMSIHVDFTPMVDMNMLLITFFMLCTTMIKSQTLSIALPSNEKLEESQQNKTKQSEAITLIIDTERDDKGFVVSETDEATGNTYPKHIVYYFEGKPYEGSFKDNDVDGDNFIDADKLKLKEQRFRGNTDGMSNGIRAILHERNKEVLAQVDELKKQWKAGELAKGKEANDSVFDARAREIRNDSTLTRPVVIIKAAPNASYEAVISALDEMQLNQISRYQIENINATDSLMIFSYLKSKGRLPQ